MDATGLHQRTERFGNTGDSRATTSGEVSGSAAAGAAPGHGRTTPKGGNREREALMAVLCLYTEIYVGKRQ